MQQQNDNLKETLDELVTLLAVCRRSVATRREILGALYWMRYFHKEESTSISASHFFAFTFSFVKQATRKLVHWDIQEAQIPQEARSM